MVENNNFGQDNVYSRYITLTGQVEETWLKTPFRVIEAVSSNTENTSTEFTNQDGGIKIYSNEVTIEDSEESQNNLWVTIDEE